ncbi:MAG TPA: prolyl aminopeptidase [Burkholderiales bacterium]
MYVEQSGNPEGFPVLFVHGGPGSQCRPAHRRFFDPDKFRIILFDQRGCGQSLPRGLLEQNTTAHLVADMEALRHYLGVQRWLLFGGSWGSTLSLAYAILHGNRVAGMILRGVFLGGRAEVEWFLYGVRSIIPEAWAEFTRDVHEPLVQHYRRLIDDPSERIAATAARRWSAYESKVMDPASASASAGQAPAEEVASVRVQLHYLAHDFFLRPGELLDNLWRIRSCPVIIVQGRMDMVCPALTALAVAQALESVELSMVENGGHSALQPQIAAALCAATRRMRDRLRAE